MGIENSAVNGSEAATGESNQNPEGGQRADQPGEREENRIPQSRVEQMWQKREQELRKSWEEKELSPVRKQFEEHQQRLTQAELARLEAMGWLQKEQPKPVTMDQLEKMFSEREAKLIESQREERLQMYYSQRISDGWREVSRKYPSLANKKTYQNAVLAMYAENPQADFVGLADEAAKDYEGYVTEREAATQKERESRRAPDRKIVPSGRGAAGGSGSGESKGKRSVAQKIQDQIKSMREG